MLSSALFGCCFNSEAQILTSVLLCSYHQRSSDHHNIPRSSRNCQSPDRSSRREKTTKGRDIYDDLWTETGDGDRHKDERSRSPFPYRSYSRSPRRSSNPQIVTTIKRDANEVNRVLIPGLYNSDSDDCRKHKHKKDKHKKQSHSRERKDKKKGLFFFALHYRNKECSV